MIEQQINTLEEGVYLYSLIFVLFLYFYIPIFFKSKKNR